jgi:NADPH-dependent curcumin reductase CurA
MTQRQWVLASRPSGAPKLDNFRLITAPLPKLEPGKALVKVIYLGVAPVMLRYMRNETAFERPMEIGDVMSGRGVAQVVQSDCPDLPEGAFIQARLGWQEYAVVDMNQHPKPFVLPHTDLPISHGISTLALSGCTALVGLRDIGHLKSSDTILVSGAGGGVGSQVAMVAKALGAERVVGIAGGADKCAALIHNMAYDEAIDYKSEPLEERLDELFPDGIDLFFDNVGGRLLDLVLARLKRRARIVICGGISEYLVEESDRYHYKNLQNLGRQDAKMEAFFVYDYEQRFTEYNQELADWIRAGLISPVEDISEGIETLPQALVDLYTGGNVGVRMVHVGDPT